MRIVAVLIFEMLDRREEAGELVGIEADVGDDAALAELAGALPDDISQVLDGLSWIVGPPPVPPLTQAPARELAVETGQPVLLGDRRRGQSDERVEGLVLAPGDLAPLQGTGEDVQRLALSLAGGLANSRADPPQLRFQPASILLFYAPAPSHLVHELPVVGELLSLDEELLADLRHALELRCARRA